MIKLHFAVTFFVIALFSSCHTAKNSSSTMLPLFDKQGHRGCRGLAPENTLPAMYKAIDLGVTTLEMDVCFTKDGEAILSHEPYFNHSITTLPDGSFITAGQEKKYNIYKMTYAETLQYDVGKKPHEGFPGQIKMPATKPRLASLVDSVEIYTSHNKLHPVFYNIETKTNPSTDNIFHPEPATFVSMLMKIILEKGIADRTIIQSFDQRTLQVLHKEYPTIKTALLIDSRDKQSPKEHIKTLGFTPDIYSPAWNLVNADLIKNCHEQKMKIIPWTVNEKAMINQLKNMGVDGIISDYPNLFND